MASVFVRNICNPVEFHKDFSPLVGREKSTQGIRNFHNFQELEEQLLIKPHALVTKYFYS